MKNGIFVVKCTSDCWVSIHLYSPSFEVWSYPRIICVSKTLVGKCQIKNTIIFRLHNMKPKHLHRLMQEKKE